MEVGGLNVKAGHRGVGDLDALLVGARVEPARAVGVRRGRPLAAARERQRRHPVREQRPLLVKRVRKREIDQLREAARALGATDTRILLRHILPNIVQPVIVQAGQSDAGRDLAARTAEVLFTVAQQLEPARAFYRDLKALTAKYGRSPDSLIIMPGIMPIMGESDQQAQDVYGSLQELLHPVAGLNSIAQLFGDLSKLPLEWAMC